MNSSPANRNCAATFEMCIIHSMTSAHFKFCFMGTMSKGGDGAKGSNYLLQFGAWDVLIEKKIVGQLAIGERSTDCSHVVLNFLYHQAPPYSK